MSNCGTILNPPTTAGTTPSEPTVTSLGNGFFRVAAPGTDLSVLATGLSLFDAILTVAAIIERNAGLRVTL